MNPERKIILTAEGKKVIEGDILSVWTAERGLSKADQMADQTIRPMIKPGWTVVDAGAALGDHTQVYLEQVGPEGRVIAIEPNEQFLVCLRHNCPGAEIVPFALWHEVADLYLHVNPANIGGGTLQPTNVAGSNGYALGPYKTITLDSLNLNRLDYMKLDVEGTEYYAMLGGERTIRTFMPIMVIEINPPVMSANKLTCDQVYKLLEDWGYDWISICGTPGKYPQAYADIHCWPKR